MEKLARANVMQQRKPLNKETAVSCFDLCRGFLVWSLCLVSHLLGLQSHLADVTVPARP